MNWQSFALFLVSAALLNGCVSSQLAQVNTPLVSLPNGGQILLQTVHTTSQDIGPGKGPLAVWKTPDSQEKLMITLVPAPGSPTGVLRIDNSSPHYNADASRVWLVRDGQTVASFDYNSGVAILGPAGQPDWANPNAGATTDTQLPPNASGTQLVPR